MKRLGIRSALLSLAFVLPVPPAQSPPAAAKPPDYDVVTVRINKSASGSVDTDVDNDTYAATNVTLKDLLEQAYDIREDLISGVPSALDSVRFDVRAKIVDPDLAALRKLTDPQRRAMLMPILIGRFHLKAHTVTRTLPVYDLTVLKGGPKFSPSPDQTSQDESTGVHNTAFTARNMPMAIFAKTLSHQLHRTVIDKTGLTGIYDLDLKWTGDDVANPDPSAPPGFFTALEEQLGLKLKPGKGPVQTLVVDHVEMPSEN